MKPCPDCKQEFEFQPYQRRCDSCTEARRVAWKAGRVAGTNRDEEKRQVVSGMRHEGLTLREIGRRLGLSGERVRQLLKGGDAEGVYRDALETRQREIAESLGHEFKGISYDTGERLALLRCGKCGNEWENATIHDSRVCPLCHHGNRRYRQTDAKMVGQQFCDWTVFERGHAPLWWWCRCKCGVEREIPATALRRGMSKGCQACGYKRRSERYARGEFQWPRKAKSPQASGVQPDA